MANEDHDPESYRLLFRLVGVAFLLLVGVLIAASSLVLATGWTVALGVLWLGAALVAWRDAARPWLPLLVATLLAVVWIAVLTLVGGAR